MGFFTNDNYIVEADIHGLGSFNEVGSIIHENRAILLADEYAKKGKRARVKKGRSVIYVAS